MTEIKDTNVDFDFKSHFKDKLDDQISQSLSIIKTVEEALELLTKITEERDKQIKAIL